MNNWTLNFPFTKIFKRQVGFVRHCPFSSIEVSAEHLETNKKLKIVKRIFNSSKIESTKVARSNIFSNKFTCPVCQEKIPDHLVIQINLLLCGN